MPTTPVLSVQNFTLLSVRMGVKQVKNLLNVQTGQILVLRWLRVPGLTLISVSGPSLREHPEPAAGDLCRRKDSGGAKHFLDLPNKENVTTNIDQQH